MGDPIQPTIGENHAFSFAEQLFLTVGGRDTASRESYMGSTCLVSIKILITSILIVDQERLALPSWLLGAVRVAIASLTMIGRNGPVFMDLCWKGRCLPISCEEPTTRPSGRGILTKGPQRAHRQESCNTVIH